MTNREVTIATVNLDRIEHVLGRPIPSGTLDMYSICDHRLSSSEINRICADLNRIDFMRGKGTRNNSILELKLLLGFLIYCAVVYGFQQLFSLG